MTCAVHTGRKVISLANTPPYGGVSTAPTDAGGAYGGTLCSSGGYIASWQNIFISCVYGGYGTQRLGGTARTVLTSASRGRVDKPLACIAHDHEIYSSSGLRGNLLMRQLHSPDM